MKTKKTRREKSQKPAARSVQAPRSARPLVNIPPILLEGDEPSQANAPEPSLPEAYGTGKLVITARDPHSLYARWDLTTAQQQRHNARSAQSHMVVRVHSSGSAVSEAEVQVHPESRHWFLHVPRADAEYVAELGYHRPDGRWVSVSKSAPARTPPDSASQDTSVQMATYQEPGAARSIHSPPAIRPSIGSPVVAHGLPTPVRQPDIRTTEKLSTTLSPPKVIAPPRVSWLPSLGLGPTESTSEQRNEQSPETSLSWCSMDSPAGSIAPADEAQAYAALEELFRSALCYERPSSPAGLPPIAESELWLDVGVELTIHGATRPGAKVTIGGQPVEVNADGTFNCRLGQRAGRNEVEVTASADAEMRSATVGLDVIIR